ncbi:MAG TPA: hypothetical protein VFX02_00940 [Gammaproteobacteria bacterium]|nr:hypothetical protein [Gammaproteobacteria bacterium]
MQSRTIFLMLASILWIPACTDSRHGYSGGSIEGDVFDQITGQPMQGVIVAAFWELEGGIHTDTQGILRADEALTDDHGHFFIPAWGPLEPVKGRLSSDAPMLLFLKDGYNLLIKANELHAPGHNPSIRNSAYNGNRFGLKPFAGDIKEYATHVSHLELFMTYPIEAGEPCYWEKIPIFTKTVLRLKNSFDQQKIYNRLPGPNSLERMGKCPNPAKILGDN